MRRRFVSILMSIAIMLGVFVATPVATSAITFNCDTQWEGQVIFRLFDYNNKVDAIYTTCTLPNIPGVTGEGAVLPSSADNKANSMVVRGYSNYQGSHFYICLDFYTDHDSVDGFLFTEIVPQGQEHSFNIPSQWQNRISSWESRYCYD